MSCPDNPIVTDAMTAALLGPKSASSDGQSVESHGLKDLIALDRYLAAKCAVKNRTRGLRFNTMTPGGTVARCPLTGPLGGSFGRNY